MRDILHFSRYGYAQASQQWFLQILRATMFATVVAMWFYVWSMMPDSLWERIHLSWALIVWYILIAEITAFTGQNTQKIIENDLREGRFQNYLSRPVSWIRIFFAQQWGYIPFNFMLIGGVAFALGVFVTHTVPFGWVLGAEILIHTIISTVIWLCLVICAGLSTLWIGTSNLAYWMLQRAGFILGGLLLPLTLYPEWLQTVALYTPFAAIYYVPAQRILPNPHFGFLDGIAYQLFVLGCVAAFTHILYKKFENKILQDG